MALGYVGTLCELEEKLIRKVPIASSSDLRVSCTAEFDEYFEISLDCYNNEGYKRKKIH